MVLTFENANPIEVPEGGLEVELTLPSDDDRNPKSKKPCDHFFKSKENQYEWWESRAVFFDEKKGKYTGKDWQNTDVEAKPKQEKVVKIDW